MKGQPFVVMVNNLNLDESWGVLRKGTLLYRQTCHSRNEYCIAKEGKAGPIRVAKSTWQLHLQQKKSFLALVKFNRLPATAGNLIHFLIPLSILLAYIARNKLSV